MLDAGQLTLRRERGRIAAWILGITLAILAVTFFRLQVLRNTQYVLRSEENRLRAISVPAPRGTIYDRVGRVIAENVPGFVLQILPGPRDSVRATLARLAPHLGFDEERQSELMAEFRARPNQALTIHENASFEYVSLVEQRRPEFANVVVQMRPRRRYPPGPAVAHMIGYVSEISRQELELPRFEDYEQGRIVGKDGLESQYESHLAGTPGVRYVEVNALGSSVREFDPGSGVPAIPGQDLQLGIDLELQVFADSTFPDAMRGGVVALDPANGEILTLYSHPTFDPNEFIGGIPGGLWRTLLEDPDRPLLNRATYATYPPGSTWKLVVSTIGMRDASFGIGSTFQHACVGSLAYGNRRFRCWKPSGHGRLDLSGAIKQSCNVFFYQAGQRIGLDALTAGVASLGFNTFTGVDLPTEDDGLFPTGRSWYDDRLGPRGWTEAVVWNLAIGQGENAQTLLRMAQFYAALATGDSPVRPHLARNETLARNRVDWSLGIPESQRLELVNAMARVVNESGGTAYPYRGNRWRAAGKTGTAQNPHGAPHSWFVGFAPAYDPRIVIASVVEQGHPDGTVSLAVPYALRIMDRYLESIGVPHDLEAGQPRIAAVASLPAAPGASR